MPDTFTTSLRIQLPATGADSGIWGSIVNTQFQSFQDAITGDNGGGINVAGLGTYTLTANNGTSDQARQLLYPFVGALTAACTVTLPGVVKIGWAVNATSGGQNIILTTGGAGTNLTIPPGGSWTFFYCDGSNVKAPQISFPTGIGSLAINGTLTVGGAATVNGSLTTTGVTSLNGAVQITNGSLTINRGQNILTNIGNTEVQFSGNGMVLQMSSSGAAAFDFLDSTQEYAWGYGATTIMTLMGGSGNLTINGTLTQGSDRRIKHNIETIEPELGFAWVRASRPVMYQIGDHWSAGFIAQEQIKHGFGEVYRLVDNDALDADEDSPAGKQYVGDAISRIAYLTAALQQAFARIEALEAARGR